MQVKITIYLQIIYLRLPCVSLKMGIILPIIHLSRLERHLLGTTALHQKTPYYGESQKRMSANLFTNYEFYDKKKTV